MKIKILTIDDSRVTRFTVRTAFNQYDCEICEAADGFDGMALAKIFLPNIIFLDLCMEQMDGLTTLKYLKKNPVLEKSTVIILSSQNDDSYIMRAMQLGASGYITKPFKGSQLLEAVQEHFSLALVA